MTFSGFPPEAARFLAELAQHNERAWFEAHRAEYERDLLEQAKAFIAALGPRLRELDPKVRASPNLGGSIKGLERRARFPRGPMPPYKEYFDLWFWSGSRRAWDNSGFFWRLTKDGLALAAGMIEFQKERLARYREHVLDDAGGSSLVSAVQALRDGGFVVGGESYKKPPRGVPVDHPRAELLRHGALFATHAASHPDELGSPALVDFCFAHFARMAALHRWLVDLAAD